jgi:hypothetical protein
MLALGGSNEVPIKDILLPFSTLRPVEIPGSIEKNGYRKILFAVDMEYRISIRLVSEPSEFKHDTPYHPQIASSDSLDLGKLLPFSSIFCCTPTTCLVLYQGK